MPELRLPVLQGTALYLLLALILRLLTMGSTAPVTPSATPPRWDQPCSGSLPQGGAASQTATTNPHKDFQTLANRAEWTKNQTSTLMNKYVSERFGDPNFPTYVKEMRLDNFPEIPTLTPGDLENINIPETVKLAYRWLASAAVFLEQVRLDEITYEVREYVPFIEDIEDKGIFRMLCSLQIYMLTNSINLDDSITRDIMKQEYRDIDVQSLRHIRDFIILRDTHKMITYLRTVFHVIANN